MATLIKPKDFNAGKIPDPRELPAVKQKIEAAITNSYHIMGGTFIGSIINNQSTILSDIDVVVLHKPDIPPLYEIFGDAIDHSLLHHIPVEIIPIDIKMCYPEFSQYFTDASFKSVVELFESQGGNVKLPVSPHLQIHGVPREAALTYIGGKIRDLSKGNIWINKKEDEDREAKIFGGALHGVFNAVRLSLVAKREPIKVTHLSTKKELIDIAKKHGLDTSYLQRAIDLLGKYKLILENPKKDEIAYEELWKQTKKTVPEGIAFFKQLVNWLN